MKGKAIVDWITRNNLMDADMRFDTIDGIACDKGGTIYMLTEDGESTAPVEE